MLNIEGALYVHIPTRSLLKAILRVLFTEAINNSCFEGLSLIQGPYRLVGKRYTYLVKVARAQILVRLLFFFLRRPFRTNVSEHWIRADFNSWKWSVFNLGGESAENNEKPLKLLGKLKTTNETKLFFSLSPKEIRYVTTVAAVDDMLYSMLYSFMEHCRLYLLLNFHQWSPRCAHPQIFLTLINDVLRERSNSWPSMMSLHEDILHRDLGLHFPPLLWKK